MSLAQFWPTRAQLADTIKSEAESFDEAVFLAVHQEMDFVYVVANQTDEKAANEADLVDWFMDPVLPQGSRIVPLAGNSGTGKTHAIRWLEAQIRRRADVEKYHITRIPKGSSLKKVLRLIVQGLEGERFDKIRANLEQATFDQNLNQEARQLRDGLVDTLRGRREEALESQEEVDQDYKRYGRKGKGLLALLNDEVVWATHLFAERNDRGTEGTGPFALIAEQISRDGDPLDDKIKRTFEEDDFLLQVDPDNDDIAMEARRFAAELNRNPAERARVARVLNLSLDEAKRRLLGRHNFDTSEIFEHIREALLERQNPKELILLIEDFVVLSGIQGPLYDAMIKEASRDGQQLLCPIRTAFAYTGGQVNVPETVRTRAHRMWLIKEEVHGGGSREFERKVLDRAVSLVADYLNAARLGAQRLAQAFSTRRGEDRWVPRFEDEPGIDMHAVESQLEPFGTAGNHDSSLFPFNRAAVEELVRAEVFRNGVPVYNPRAVVNSVYLHVLGQRNDFENRAFPSRKVGTGHLQVDVQKLVSYQDRRLHDRYTTLLRFWGGNPPDLASLPAWSEPGTSLYSAFDLPPLKSGDTRLPPTIPPSSRGKIATLQTPSAEDPWVVERKRWRRVLELWRDGDELPPASAVSLRKAIARHLSRLVPTDWASLHRESNLGESLADNYLYLPGGCDRTLKPADSAIVFCSQKDRRDPMMGAQRMGELLAVLATEGEGVAPNEGTYPELAEDRHQLGCLRARLLPEFVAWLRDRPALTAGAQKQEEALDPALRVLWYLALASPEVSQIPREAAKRLNLLFASPADDLAERTPGGIRPWVEQLISHRDLALTIVRDTFGCGPGAVHGIDGTTILKALDKVLAEPPRRPSTTEKRLPTRRTENWKELQAAINDAKPRLGKHVDYCRDQYRLLEDSIPESVRDFQQDVKAFLEVIEQSGEVGAKGGTARVHELLGHFDSSNLGEDLRLLDAAGSREELTSASASVRVLSRSLAASTSLHFDQLESSCELMRVLQSLMSAAKSVVSEGELGTSRAQYDESASSLRQTLDEIADLVGEEGAA